MRALIIKQLNAIPEIFEIPNPTPGKNEAIVNIRAAALNHRDLFITQGLYAGIKTPCVLGSDGAGEWRGRRVLLYPALEWCNNPNFQGKNFRVLGMPENGCFAEQIWIPRKNIFPVADHLDWEQAAALPLAGLTAWRTRCSPCKLEKGEKVRFTCVGLEPVTITIPDTLTQDRYAIVQLMSQDTILLPEAVIFPWPSIISLL